MSLCFPNHIAGCELAPVYGSRLGPTSVAAIFAHVVLSVHERLLLGGGQAEFARRQRDLEAAEPIEQMHGPQSVRAPMDLDGERLDFRQTGISRSEERRVGKECRS